MWRLLMVEGSRDDAHSQVLAARLQGKRVALGIVLFASFAIIGSSTLQIVPAVFGLGIRPLPEGLPGSAARSCAEGVQRLDQALDRAVEGTASVDFSTRLQPEWEDKDAVQRACSESPAGLDAWAALARLRSAEEQLGPDGRGLLAPLRRDVRAHLPADLR
jgi:hypothetical protein